ncbi:MAG: hypothetical protein ACMUJM_23340 [bacterium]
MVWYTYQLQSQYNLIEQDMTRLLRIDNLVANLANQKGLLSYYFIDGNSEWLNELEGYHQKVRLYLEQLKDYTSSDSDKTIIKNIEKDSYLQDIKLVRILINF